MSSTVTVPAAQAVASPTNWREFFDKWPRSISRRGVLITSFGEHFNFSEFITSDVYLMIRRETPDIDGTRTIVLDYDGIRAVKIIDLLKPNTLTEFGFGWSVCKLKM
jgi:hypothetical protein